MVFVKDKIVTFLGRVGHSMTLDNGTSWSRLRTRWSLFNKFGKLKILGYAFCNYWGMGSNYWGDIYPHPPTLAPLGVVVST